MAAKIPLRTLYSGSNAIGVSEYQSGDTIQVDNGIVMASDAGGTKPIYIDSDGGYGWRDITSDISVRGIGANNPSFTVFRNGIYAYEFPGSAASLKEAWLNFHIPHDYVLGTDIYFHAHWGNATATPSTNNVSWGFEYTFAKGHNQAAFPATNTVYAYEACSSTRYQHMVTETAAVTMSGLEADSIILCRVFRDANYVNDTNTDTVHLFFVDLHYQSNNLATKNKSPNFYT